MRLDSVDYSVDPCVIGRIVDVEASLDRVRVTCEGRLVADHRRCFVKGSVISDPQHVHTARVLRESFQNASKANSRKYETVTQVVQADLASYDALWEEVKAV